MKKTMKVRSIYARFLREGNGGFSVVDAEVCCESFDRQEIKFQVNNSEAKELHVGDDIEIEWTRK